ncbi:Maf family protein [Sneathiella aquimaris]|uniref:Maf family protein n=1 Tax=Sneathiella aquimaris TaxID=2599305 RepID=UPI00146E8A51|nr:Maf family protein [Sneathiella aquimaris]
MNVSSNTAVILASSSEARATVLKNVGLPFEQIAPKVDEEELKHSMHAAGATAMETAVSLAELKALKISKAFPEHLVIGADQMLECGSIWFDKPVDMEHARAHLTALRGKTHYLSNGICVAKSSTVIWHHTDQAALTMRHFTDEFLTRYLEQAGEDILGSVGAYHLEGLGAQLFRKIDGDFFSIMGLPLLPLLDFLRGHKVVIT